MIDSKKSLEKYLQQKRFETAKKWIVGDVLDFGGNDGELKPLVTGEYTIVNYDHGPMVGKSFDTIVTLAVVEHIPVEDVYKIFESFKKQLRPNGKIILTTPTPRSKPILEALASIHILDKQNIEEHEHYWSQEELQNLATRSGLEIVHYEKFQLGCNQFAVMQHRSGEN